MNYTKEDLRKFFLAGRRFGLSENSEHTTMNFDRFFDVYSQIQEDIKKEEKEKQKQALIEIMETDAKNGMYDQHKEQWKGWIDMKRIEEMKKSDEDKIKIKIKKDSEAAKLIDAMKTEKQEFKKTVESAYNKKQTAVEWLFEKVMITHLDNLDEIFEQAKQMEKEQLNIARLDGINLANKGYGK